MIRLARCLLMLMVPLCAAPAPVQTRPTLAKEEVVNHPDGTVSFRVKLNAEGKRAGDFTAYFAGGKKIQEKARYEAGLLHGQRTVFDEKGKVLVDESWHKGRLVIPKSIRLIEATKAEISRDVVDLLRKNPPAIPRGGLSLQLLGDALIKLRTYRYYCDVSTDVGYDDSYIDLCQHGAEVLAMINELTHTPRKPEGVSEEFYAKAKKGCGSSNIFTGNNIVQSVDAYMDDSDKSNIDRLGHRRWVLNPAMQNTGFGAGASRYSAMYSFDSKRKEVPDYKFVAFPPRGFFPLSQFRASLAWHVSLNPKHYDVKASDAKMAIYSVDGNLTRAKEPLELNYEHVNLDGFGVANAIIARPKSLLLKAGVMYEVVITGVKAREDDPKEISYFVSFY